MPFDEVSNSTFLRTVLGELEEGTHGWVCHFTQDPQHADPDVWTGRAYQGIPVKPAQAAVIDKVGDANAYFSTAVLRATSDMAIVRRKEAFHRLAVLLADDADLDQLQGQPTYVVQTSSGKHQVGIAIDFSDVDARDRALVDRLMSSMAERGLMSLDRSGNNAVRYGRLPVGRNLKAGAGHWPVRLEAWNPNQVLGLADAAAVLQIDLDALRAPAAVPASEYKPNPALRSLAGFPEGQRNQDVYRYACSLRARNASPEEARVLVLHQAAACTPPMSQAEALRCLESAWKHAPGKSEDFKTFEVITTADTPPEPQPLDLVELSSKQWPPTTWAVADMLPHGHVTLLSANGGVGKSTVALQMAVAVATGTEFLGQESTQGRVLVFSAEDGDAILHARLAHIAAAAGTTLASLAAHMTVLDATRCEPTMWSEAGPTARLSWLAERAAQERPSLLIIDNASDVFAAGENDRARVRGFMRCLNVIAATTGAAVLLLAHVDKASVRGLVSADTLSTFSGSTAWHNSARSRLAMTREGEMVSLRHEKANLGPQLPDIELEFDSSAKLFRLAGTIPGQAAARALMRSQHRLAVMRLIKQATEAGQNLSMRAKASTNAFLQLRSEPGFPQALERGEFFTLLRELTRDGLLNESTVITPSRNRVQVIKLTDAGELRVAAGSAAPAMWHTRAAA